MKQFSRLQKRVSLALVLFAATFGAAGCASLSSGGNSANAAKPQSEVTLPAPSSNAPVTTGDGVRASYADVVDRVSPAVVNIIVQRRAAPAAATGGLEQLFPDLQNAPEGGRRAPQVQRGAGSGVIVTADGTILTNNHVIEGATDIEIQLNDKRSFKARVVGTDAPSDLAVVKVEENNLPFLNLGDSDKVRVGDVVLAVGNPLGIGQTVTLGIISAKGRQTGISSGDSFEDFLQTDAPINRGNSGGALVNLTGELIGINSQILSSGMSGGSIGIGFAIPSNMARGVTEQLVKNGKVRRGLLGVNIQDITSETTAALSLKQTRGALVSNVQPGSPAEKAGLKRYDIITALNGERIEDGNGFRNRVAALPPGTEVTITVDRKGEEQQLKATLTERTAETATREGDPGNQNPTAPAENGKLGLNLQPLTPEIARELQVQADKGLVVLEVDEAGPAAEKGIRRGDVILEINRQPVGNFEEMQAELQKAGERPVGILIARRGQTVFLTIQPRR